MAVMAAVSMREVQAIKRDQAIDQTTEKREGATVIPRASVVMGCLEALEASTDQKAPTALVVEATKAIIRDRSNGTKGRIHHKARTQTGLEINTDRKVMGLIWYIPKCKLIRSYGWVT